MEYSVFYNSKTRSYAMKQSSGILDPCSVVRTFSCNNYYDALKQCYEITNEIISLKKIPVVIIDYLEEPVYTSVYNSINEFRRIVSGNIEIVNLIDANSIDVICCEEGKFNRLPLNRSVLDGSKVIDVIAGTMIITKSDEEGSTLGLTHREIDLIHSYYYYPEVFNISDNDNSISVIKVSTEAAKIMKQNLVSNVSIIK